jgi:putative tricarboxylic transport membrane protein
MKFKESNVHQVAGGILLLFSLLMLFLIIPAQIRNVQSIGVTPRFMPQLLTVLLAILSILLAVDGYRKRELPDQKEYEIDPVNLKLFAITFVVMIINVLLVNTLGYLISTALTLLALMLVYGQRNLKYMIPVALLVPFAIQQFLTRLLYVRLP